MPEKLELRIHHAMHMRPSQFLADRIGKSVEEIHADLLAAGITIGKQSVHKFLERNNFRIPEKIEVEVPEKNWPPAKREYETILKKADERRAIAQIARKYKVTYEQSRSIHDIYFNQTNNFRQPFYVLSVLQSASERVAVGIESLLPEHFEKKRGASYQESFLFKIYLGMTDDADPLYAIRLMQAASRENPNATLEPFADEEDERVSTVFARGTPKNFQYVSPWIDRDSRKDK